MDGVRSGITRPAGRRVRRSPGSGLGGPARRARAVPAAPWPPITERLAAHEHTGQAASSLPIGPVATVSARPMVLTLAVICL